MRWQYAHIGAWWQTDTAVGQQEFREDSERGRVSARRPGLLLPWNFKGDTWVLYRRKQAPTPLRAIQAQATLELLSTHPTSHIRSIVWAGPLNTTARHVYQRPDSMKNEWGEAAFAPWHKGKLLFRQPGTGSCWPGFCTLSIPHLSEYVGSILVLTSLALYFWYLPHLVHEGFKYRPFTFNPPPPIKFAHIQWAQAAI